MREGYVPECFRATFFILIKLLVKVHRSKCTGMQACLELRNILNK